MKKHSLLKFALCLILASAFFASTVTYAITPRNEIGYYWDKDTVRCYIDPTVTTTYGASVYNAICFGILAWNTTDVPIAVLSDHYTDWNVHVSMEEYGNTGWNGYHQTSYDKITLVTNYSIIHINYSGLQNYLSDTGLWKAIACHEMGHAYGADHNTTDGEQSILKPSTEKYYNCATGSPNISTPQPPDITCVNAIY